MSSSGIDQVTSRIAALQARLGLSSAGVMGGGTGTAGTATSGTGFSSALADALGLTGADAVTGTGTATGATGGGAAGGGATGGVGARAVALARTYTGVPYRWGGTDPAQGLDCSGLTQLVYSQLGVALPRVAADQARTGTAVASLAQAQPGDLVFFGSPAHHVGIFVGDGQMIDAPHTGSTVGVHDIAGYGTVSAIRRVAPATAASGVGAAGVGAAGTLALARAQLLSAAGLASLSGLDSSSGLDSTDPSFPETRTNVQRVTDAWEALR